MKSLEDFNSWHDNLCERLGYPLTPVNQLTGLLDEEAQKVTRYCDAKEHEGVFISQVEDAYSDGLTPINYVPKLPDFNR